MTRKQPSMLQISLKCQHGLLYFCSCLLPSPQNPALQDPLGCVWVEPMLHWGIGVY